MLYKAWTVASQKLQVTSEMLLDFWFVVDPGNTILLLLLLILFMDTYISYEKDFTKKHIY